MTQSIPVLDTVKREAIKAELIALMRNRAPGTENGLQFEGVTLDNPTPENLVTLLILRDLCSEHRQYSIVQWPGGISLVRTAQVDALEKAIQDVNEKHNYILRGGSDKIGALLDADGAPIARPSKPITEHGE